MGWGRKLRESLFGLTPVHVAQAGIEAVNSRDWEALRRLLSEGFEYRDRDGNLVVSPDSFIAALEALVLTAADFRLEVDDYQDAGNQVVMRGRTVSANAQVRSESVWRMKVRRGKMLSLESFHANEGMRLYRYAPTPPATEQ